MLENKIKLFLLCIFSIPFVGCYSVTQSAGIEAERDVFMYSVRQLPLQPVYNRLRNVRPPGPMPVLTTKTIAEAHFEPYYSFILKNSTYEEAAQKVAKSVGYSFYCSSFIANKRVSIRSSGSINQIAAEISAKTGAKMIIDHDNREVRFLLQDGEQ